MIEEKILRCRKAEEFERKYLRKEFNHKISVMRILDSRKENFHLSKAYRAKVAVINVITAPEIEVLIIHDKGIYDKFKRSGKKPSVFCKEELKMSLVKEYDFVHAYFNDPNLLLHAIEEYRRKASVQRSEYTLSDLLKK